MIGERRLFSNSGAGRANWALLVVLSLGMSAVAQAQPGGDQPAAGTTTRQAPSSNDQLSLFEIGISAALERARSFYQSGRYDSCASAYGELFERENELTDKLSRDSLEQARVHYAACLLALGNRPDAEQQVRAAIRANPLMAAPDPVVFPAQVRDLFFKVKADFVEEIRKAQEERLRQAQLKDAERLARQRSEQQRVQRLETLAATETLIHRNQRWIAAIPFGVGQFQNGHRALGAVFLVTELGLAGAAVAAASVELSLHSQADGGRRTWEAEKFNRAIATTRAVSLWSGVALVGMAALGILEAQLNFVEEIPAGVRPRPLPPDVAPQPPRQEVPSAGAAKHFPQFEPEFGFDRQSAWIGLGGRF